ncbi:hypothetical protein EZJ19_07950 [Parasulfuritortus cantonensis]|uniref:DUF4231 domain-containing protein n=1 Tax=Parasulfuritortus cantonensis TaxID=2528202 RepID=A0A4R1BDR8_9PROT|nr:hypothetical protein [Parasulfuritortus cantonensis]TCJ15231.1 hypothetical protein EZJ19_07950 [Parasulfuritortus cantonensis]
MDKDELERAKIAVEEYKVLHAELLQRNNLLIQMSGACIAAIVALIGFMANGALPVCWGIGLVVFVLLILGGIWKIVDSDARNACKRIGEIEEYVNKSVGGDDYMPLSWERRFGILKRNYSSRFLTKDKCIAK